MNKRCFYFVEGECEETLINALKKDPGQIIPGRVKKWNVIYKMLPNSILNTIQPGSIVILVFDTDVQSSGYLEKNILLLKKVVSKVLIICLPQVLNLEDELERCTDIKNVKELTKSKSRSDFKRDFCRLTDCRQTLDAHNLNIGKMWTQPIPEGFTSFSPYTGNRKQIIRQGK